jgi:hypothetical protein
MEYLALRDPSGTGTNPVYSRQSAKIQDLRVRGRIPHESEGVRPWSSKRNSLEIVLTTVHKIAYEPISLHCLTAPGQDAARRRHAEHLGTDEDMRSGFALVRRTSTRKIPQGNMQRCMPSKLPHAVLNPEGSGKSYGIFLAPGYYVHIMPLAPGYYVHLMYRLKLWHVVRQQQYWLTLRKRVPTRKPPG